MARVLARRAPEQLPQLTLAAILGSTLMDGDSWLYLIGPDYYGKYHRVLTHNVWGLALCALAAAGIALWAARRPSWRRFGWFAATNLPASDPPPDAAPARRFVLVAMCCAYLHFCADAITGYGNVLPWWPFSWWDASLHLVTSFDAVIFSSTLAWHIAARWLAWPWSRERWLHVAYWAVVLSYLTVRWMIGERTVW